MPRVLLACDATSRRDEIVAAFAGTDLDTTLSSDGADVLHLARAVHPDALVIVDSPTCDAVSMLTGVRGDRSLHACMVIAVAMRDRHPALLRAGLDQALGSGSSANDVLDAVLGRLARRAQLLDAAGTRSRRRDADAMVEVFARESRLHGVVALHVERLDQLCAALGSDGALVLRSQLRDRLTPAMPTGGELAMLDGGMVAAVDGTTGSALEVAESLLRAARQPLQADGRELRLRVHAGFIDCAGKAGADPVTALRRAEAAAREARHLGAATPQPWHDELGARLLGDLELASAMQRAVEQADFRLVFQPQVRMERGEPFGVEALIRWNLPGGMSVPPARFVALAEESGLIDDIGAWSLREACRQAMAWEESGMRLRVAVNASPRQVSQPRFVDTVRQALAESGLAGDRLVIELSEGALLREARAVSQTLEALRTLGVQLCVDDFGAGLATLASLRGLPITEIKIDRSFVRALPGTAEDRMAVETVLRLAHQMGLRATAVGVENAAQWAWLKEQGCDAAQGWLIGKPVEGHELAATVASLRKARGQFAEPVRA